MLLVITIFNLDELGPSGSRDFENSTRAIVFRPGGPTSQMVQFPVFDDVVSEETEGFIIVLDVDEPQTDRNQVLFNAGMRTTLGKINDNDRKH